MIIKQINNNNNNIFYLDIKSSALCSCIYFHNETKMRVVPSCILNKFTNEIKIVTLNSELKLIRTLKAKSKQFLKYLIENFTCTKIR